MRILFISSGNSLNGISTIVSGQGESLKSFGHEVDYFAIKGKGVLGYLSNLKRMRIHLRSNKYDIIHAHYSFSAFLAVLARAQPLVVSLMGSDVNTSTLLNLVIRRLAFHNWKQLIVKSSSMQEGIGIRNAHIIPNGVNLATMKPRDITNCRNEIGWSNNKHHILFGSSPSRPEKNFELFSLAFQKFSNKELIEIHSLENISPEMVPVYLNASSVVVLTSLWEGSPNVIKEAMACNRPLVATEVGDIKWLFGSEAGHYLTSFNPEDVASKIKAAIDFSVHTGETEGRKRIIALGLDSETIANKLIAIYQSCLA